MTESKLTPGVPRGQALVIVAFAMAVLLGISALVVDLGMSWMLRRQEQNAADPGAIAAARYIEEGDTAATRTKMHTAACFYAKQNGFFETDTDDCATARAAGALQVNWPPIGPMAGQFAGRPEMVQVVIRDEHPSFFGRIFGRSTASVANAAVAARETQSSNSNSLVALDPVSCAAGHVNGNGVVTISPVTNPDTGTPFSGGYVHVNSACAGGNFDNQCSVGDGAFKKSGSASGKLVAPHVYIHGTCGANPSTVQAGITEGAPQIGDPLASLRGPRQEQYPAGYCPRAQGTIVHYDLEAPTGTMAETCSFTRNGMTVTLEPGVYWGGWSFGGNNVTVKLKSGIYIIAGGGISVTGSATVAAEDITGPDGGPARVMIYNTDNTIDPACNVSSPPLRCVQGPIDFVGQSSFKVRGLDSGPWKGMLIWQDGQGSNPAAPIKIGGLGALDIAGTIYAPQANVKIQGNAAGTGVASIQIISWTWEIFGNGALTMPYDPGELYQITQRGLVH